VDLAATVFSTGWASGLNAYATVALLGLLGRAGVGEVPDSLQSDPVIAIAAVMFVIEFVVDKVPWLDSAWDVVGTFVRPTVGAAVGGLFAGDAGVEAADKVFAAAGGGGTALASHAVKAGFRLGVNASPEPASNAVTSLVEDGLVAAVVALTLENPVAAAVIAAILLITGAGLVAYLWKRVRLGIDRVRARRAARRSGRAPP
jgi:hypothetical protein